MVTIDEIASHEDIKITLPKDGQEGVVYIGTLPPVDNNVAGMDALAPKYNHSVIIAGVGTQIVGGESLPRHILSVDEVTYLGG